MYGTVPARVASVGNEEAAIAQMKLGSRLWNVLVAIERARVSRYRRIMHDEVQERIEETRGQLAALRQEAKDRRKAVRGRAHTEDLLPQIAQLKLTIADPGQFQKQTSEGRHDARRGELTALTERTKRRIKRARQAAAKLGLFWGTYNNILQRADTGRKHGGELQFRGFRGEGTVTAQIQGGIPA